VTDKAVAKGLHQALRRLRDAGTESVPAGRDATLLSVESSTQFYWIPYVHFRV
jgi:hypothetical protein